MHFGRLLYVCQSLLGLDPKDTHDYGFINSKQYSVDELREFFSEMELENGKLGFVLHVDDMGSTGLATIETTFTYGATIPDQLFLNLVADFIEYVQSLPLEGAGEDPFTEEELLRAHQEAAHFLGPLFEGLAAKGYDITESLREEDDIPF